MRRAKLLLLIFGLLGLGVIVVFGVVYKDVAIEAWYLSELETADEDGKKAAITRLVELRSVKAVPQLVAMTIHRSELADVAEKALEAIGAPAVAVLVRSSLVVENEAELQDAYIARNAAVLTLRILEKHPEEIIAVLRRYDGESGYCDLVIQRFFRERDDLSASLVLEPLRPRDAATRCAFLGSLALVSEDSRTARSVILSAARDETAEVRVCALNSLEVARPREPGFETVLVEALRDSVLEIRLTAANLLLRCKGTTDPVHDALLEAFLKSQNQEAGDHAMALAAVAPQRLVQLLSHESVAHRRLAIAALADTAYAPARDAYMTSLQSDPDGEARLAALDALGSLGEKAADVVPALLEFLRDGPQDLRAPAILTLGQIGARAETVVPVLVEHLTAEEAEIRRFAAAALEGFGKQAAPAIPALVKALEDLAIADWAVFALAACGTQAVSAIKVAFEHKVARVRWGAVMAIERMGSSGVRLAEARLCELLSSDLDSEVRGAAANALGRLGPLSDETLTKIERAFEDGDWSVRLNALETFVRGDETNARADTVMPIIESALQDPKVDEAQRGEALVILRLLGEKGIPVWIVALEDANAWIRREAVRQLADFGSAASEAVPALEKRQQDEDADVRTAVGDALERIGETQDN